MIFFIITILAMDCDALTMRVFRGLCVATGVEVAMEAIALTAMLSGIVCA